MLIGKQSTMLRFYKIFATVRNQTTSQQEVAEEQIMTIALSLLKSKILCFLKATKNIHFH